MNRYSLKLRLPVYTAAAVALPLLVLMFIVFTQVNRLVVQQKIQDMMNIADTKYVHVLDMLEQKQLEAEQLATTPLLTASLRKYQETGNQAELGTANSYLADTLRRTRMRRPHSFGRHSPTRNRLDEIMLLNADGKVVAGTGASTIGVDMRKTAYFATKKTSFVDAYRDSNGQVVFGYSAPIRDNGRLVGMLATKTNVKMLQMIMTGELGNITGGKLFFAGFSPGYDFYIMNKDGYMITQSRTTGRDTVLKVKGSKEPLRRTLDVDARGNRMTNISLTTGAREAMGIFTDFHGREAAGASMPVFGKLWTVVVEQDTSEAFAALISLERALVVVSLLAFVLTAAGSWKFISRAVTEPLAALADTATAITAGNLHTRAPATSKDEIGALARAFNHMTDGLEHMVEVEQRAQMELRTALKKYKETTLETKSHAAAVAASAEHSSSVSESGRAVVEKAVAGMGAVKHKVEEIARNVRALSGDIQRIEDIMGTMNDFSDQSNLLAINAAIEAARAGEQGKSFAVVVESIKKLANQSRQATDQVRSTLDAIRAATTTVVATTEENMADIDASARLAKELGQVIGELSESIHASTAAAHHILDVAQVRVEDSGAEDRAA